MSQDGQLIGYARTSTVEQQAGLEAQLRDLKAAGCRKLFFEQVSAVCERTQLEAALDYCREGDTLVVTKIDRLARSARNLSEMVDSSKERDAADVNPLALLSLSLRTSTLDDAPRGSSLEHAMRIIGLR